MHAFEYSVDKFNLATICHTDIHNCVEKRKNRFLFTYSNNKYYYD